MRIVGGRLGGRTLAGPKSQAIRPTSDRLRESLFNILAHGRGDPVTGARVLDLFAGTGALGLEAMSRGARFALFIDDGAQARALMRQNVEALGLGGVTRIFRRDATRLGAAYPVEPFSLAFLDPPYRHGLAERALASLRAGDWLTPDALVVVEEATDAGFQVPEGFAEIDRRRYDDTEFIFLTLNFLPCLWGRAGEGAPQASRAPPPRPSPARGPKAGRDWALQARACDAVVSGAPTAPVQDLVGMDFMAILDAASPSSFACAASSFICAWANSVWSAITCWTSLARTKRSANAKVLATLRSA
jgi:16S rRNA (guanine966-N2)-methyltransferase